MDSKMKVYMVCYVDNNGMAIPVRNKAYVRKAAAQRLCDYINERKGIPRAYVLTADNWY